MNEDDQNKVQALPFKEWMTWNLSNKSIEDHIAACRDHFAIIIWWIWRWQNLLIFKNMKPAMWDKLGKINRYSHEVLKAMDNCRIREWPWSVLH